MNPKLSIVFTSYNHKEYLKQALDSLVGQTFQDFELIIIDDCSTDGSQEVLKAYEGNEKVRLYLQEKNSGSYVKASNLGASYARGEFMLFAQCDDFAEPTQIETLMKAFDSSSAVGVSFCRSSLVDERGKVIGNDYDIRERSFKNLCVRDTVILAQQMRDFLLKSCVIPNLSAAIFRKKYFDELGGLSEKYIVASDWCFWLEMAEKCNFYYTAAALNNFRQHETTIRSKVKIKRQILEIYDILFSHVQKHNLSERYSKILKNNAALIWSSYFLQSPKSWISSFGSVGSAIRGYDNRYITRVAAAFLNKVGEKIRR